MTSSVDVPEIQLSQPRDTRGRPLPKSIPDQSYADPHCGADSKRDSRSRGHEHQLA